MFQDSDIAPLDLEPTFTHFLGQDNPISLQKDHFGSEHPNRIPLDLDREAYSIHFDQIFFTNFPPNISTSSISTRSNRSQECLDLSEEFFQNNFTINYPDQEPLEYEPLGSLGQNSNDQLKLSKPQILQSHHVDNRNISEEKPGDELQNSHDQTKNIPKNYIKAIFSFILEESDYIQRLFGSSILKQVNCSLSRFLEYVRLQKKTKRYTIERLKSLWMDPQNGKAMRIISFQFLRRRSMGYIFGSKIEKKMHHIKHRGKFIKAVGNPSEFTSIK